MQSDCPRLVRSIGARKAINVGVSAETVQVILHLKDQNWCAADIAAKFGLNEDAVREILARRGHATRERAGVYSAGRRCKRHSTQAPMSLQAGEAR